MLTIDDIRSIPLFSTLPLAELERLARTSADVHLSAGEFAVHAANRQTAKSHVIQDSFENRSSFFRGSLLRKDEFVRAAFFRKGGREGPAEG